MSRGFTMVELMIAVVVAGMLLAIGVPRLAGYWNDVTLRGASGQLANAIMMTRDRAMTTGVSRTMHFQAGSGGSDYRAEVAGVVSANWKLPRNISYVTGAGTLDSLTIDLKGHSSAAGLIVLRTPTGIRDTISVLSSGLVLTQ